MLLRPLLTLASLALLAAAYAAHAQFVLLALASWRQQSGGSPDPCGFKSISLLLACYNCWPALFSGCVCAVRVVRGDLLPVHQYCQEPRRAGSCEWPGRDQDSKDFTRHRARGNMQSPFAKRTDAKVSQEPLYTACIACRRMPLHSASSFRWPLHMRALFFGSCLWYACGVQVPAHSTALVVCAATSSGLRIRLAELHTCVVDKPIPCRIA